MNHFFPDNIDIKTVERAGRIDRYGKSLLEVVATHVRGNIEIKRRSRRSPQGDEVQIDGSLMLGNDIVLFENDIVTVDNLNEDKYEVFGVDESQDAGTGEVVLRTYDLTRKR